MTAIDSPPATPDAKAEKATNGEARRKVHHLTSTQLRRLLKSRGIDLPHEESSSHSALVRMCHERGIEDAAVENGGGGVKSKVAALGLHFQPGMLLPGGRPKRQVMEQANEAPGQQQPHVASPPPQINSTSSPAVLEHMALSRAPPPRRSSSSKGRRTSISSASRTPSLSGASSSAPDASLSSSLTRQPQELASKLSISYTTSMADEVCGVQRLEVNGATSQQMTPSDSQPLVDGASCSFESGVLLDNVLRSTSDAPSNSQPLVDGASCSFESGVLLDDVLRSTSDAKMLEERDLVEHARVAGLDETLAWVRNGSDEWVIARVVARAADGAVELETLEEQPDGSKRRHSAHTQDLLLLNHLPADGVDDMVLLDHLHEPALLDNLRVRFSRNIIYTYTGKICIALNPFDWDASGHLYSRDNLQAYQARNPADLPPHVYSIGEQAYRRAKGSNSCGESILVSGESGAGKTETVKILMNYIAQVAGTDEKVGTCDTVSQRVLASNPLLESFGNACTLRNDNSSRFGKFIQMLLNESGQVCGSKLSVYLLEKSRIISQATGERNYHFFYQLTAGACWLEKVGISLARLRLKKSTDFQLLSASGRTTLAGVDDAAKLQGVLEAMTQVGISTCEQGGVASIVCAVLHLSELDFISSDEDESSAVLPDELEETVEHSTLLLELVSSSALRTALCKRQLAMGGREVMEVPMKVDQAVASRDALLKALYARLFSWLVERCNTTLIDNAALSTSFIGILDIFGFETFDTNSFEQLCINYANERLQQQFNKDIFKEQQAEYEAEGIDWEYIPFADNQQCLDLLDKRQPPGVLPLLDEQCSIQSGNDASFCREIRERLRGHPNFDAPRTQPGAFGIRHYSGLVIYTSDGFRDKNLDALHPDLATEMGKSTSLLVQALFPVKSEHSSGKPQLGKGRPAGRVSVGGQFMAQLASLMKTIDSSGVHYIRCAKPNQQNKPSFFHNSYVAMQLRSAGVLEAVRISRMAFPNRMQHKACIWKFALLGGDDWRKLNATTLRAGASALNDDDARALCGSLLQAALDQAERYELGKTRVYFREFALESLDRRRGEAIAGFVATMQAFSRRWRARARLKEARQAACRLQRHARGRAVRRQIARSNQAAVALQACARRRATRKAYVACVRSSIALQASIRRRIARRRARREQAARSWQRWIRGFLVRCALRRVQQERRQHGAATKLQSRARARCSRTRWKLVRSSTIALQCAQRQRAARSYHHQVRAERQLRLESARKAATVKIQSAMRRHASHVMWSARKSATVMIQRGVRAMLVLHRDRGRVEYLESQLTRVSAEAKHRQVQCDGFQKSLHLALVALLRVGAVDPHILQAALGGDLSQSPPADESSILSVLDRICDEQSTVSPSVIHAVSARKVQSTPSQAAVLRIATESIPTAPRFDVTQTDVGSDKRTKDEYCSSEPPQVDHTQDCATARLPAKEELGGVRSHNLSAQLQHRLPSPARPPPELSLQEDTEVALNRKTGALPVADVQDQSNCSSDNRASSSTRAGASSGDTTLNTPMVQRTNSMSKMTKEASPCMGDGQPSKGAPPWLRDLRTSDDSNLSNSKSRKSRRARAQRASMPATAAEMVGCSLDSEHQELGGKSAGGRRSRRKRRKSYGETTSDRKG